MNKSHTGATAWTAASSPAPNLTINLDRLLEDRYSCRSFEHKRAISLHCLELLLSAAAKAPSACNLQPYHFEVITGESLARVERLRNFYGASALIIGSFDPQNPGYVSAQGQEFRLFDLGLALMTIALKATELGLDSCFIGSLPVKELKATLKLTTDPVIALALGYPAADAAPSENHELRRTGAKLYTIYD
ncbi:MAG: nitroreductase family protein [Anaerobiospirillum sp.]|nr:nitroreductase family protein [Anaerobiospirillum sp.]